MAFFRTVGFSDQLPVVSGDDVLLRNFEGKVYRYPDPEGTLGRDRIALAAE